jgi:peptidoglycan/LPS O-acetylase OafA/YrhL
MTAYRPELDGLRAIAILAVMLYHAKLPLCQGGYVGVDVFFVLSGFFMTSIITRDIQKNEFTLLKFYERRARRILPMLYCTIAITYLPAYTYLIAEDFHKFAKTGLLASLGLSNLYFAATTKGYFDTSTDLIPLIHTWTLGVEEQFYVIIPLLFVLFTRFGRKIVPSVLIILALISFSLTFLPEIDPVYSFYMLYTRFWELAIGSLLTFLPKMKESNVFSAIGLFLILTATVSFNESMPDPSYFTLCPTIGTALVILFANSQTLTGRFLSTRPLVLIGLISYSAYLIHQPLFAFVRLQSIIINDVGFFITLVLFTLSISYLTWRLIEQPFRDKDKISINKMFIFCLVYFVLFRTDSFSLIFNSLDSQLTVNQQFSATTIYTLSNKTNRLVKKLPKTSLFNYGETSPVGKRCFQHHVYGTKTTKPQLCRLGLNKTASPVYFLYGDSYAMVMSNLFDELEPPGMFASQNGEFCPTLVRANVISTPSRIQHKGEFY